MLLQASPCRRRCRSWLSFVCCWTLASWLVSSNTMSLSTAPQLPCPANIYCTALQYLAELDETQKREGPAALRFGKPLQPVSASELGFAGARLDSLVSCLWRLL